MCLGFSVRGKGVCWARGGEMGKFGGGVRERGVFGGAEMRLVRG